jgi:hypothetical protein
MSKLATNAGFQISVDKVWDIAKTVTTLKIKLPASSQTMVKTMCITEKHRQISRLFDDDFWGNLK